MNLDNYLRSVVKQNILKYLTICSCEKCGSTHNLDIHHDDIYFFEMVDKTLNDLELPYYQDKDKYSKEELEKIQIYILGLHMKGKYKILCEECHNIEHKKCYKRREIQLTGFDLVKSRRFKRGESIAQKIVFWIEHKNDGEIFSIKELLCDLEITRDEFKSAKRDNKVINDYFKTHLANGYNCKYYVVDTNF
jgi:hypothetical protein